MKFLYCHIFGVPLCSIDFFPGEERRRNDQDKDQKQHIFMLLVSLWFGAVYHFMLLLCAGF